MRKAYLLTPLLSGVLLLAACTPATDTTNPQTDDSSSSMMMDDSSTMSDHDMGDMHHDMSSMPMDESSSSAVMQPSSASSAAVSASSTPPQAARVIEMTVTDFAFAPNAITVKKGEKVVVRLHGLEGTHSFGSQELGINVAVPAGTTKDIPIPTDKAGTFSFRCTIPCGPGHMGMTGTITVEG